VIELTPEPKASETTVPEGVRAARAAFLRDFPALFSDRTTRGKYVCYHNETRVAVTDNYGSMIREIGARNIPEDASLVVKVTPGADGEERAFADESELP
jgi:hypothetical protein